MIWVRMELEFRSKRGEIKEEKKNIRGIGMMLLLMLLLFFFLWIFIAMAVMMRKLAIVVIYEVIVMCIVSCIGFCFFDVIEFLERFVKAKIFLWLFYG